MFCILKFLLVMLIKKMRERETLIQIGHGILQSKKPRNTQH